MALSEALLWIDGNQNKNEEIQGGKPYRWIVRYSRRNREDSRTKKNFPSNDIRPPQGDFWHDYMGITHTTNLKKKSRLGKIS